MAENTKTQSGAAGQSDAGVLAAIQEVLLNARISNLTGNEDNWNETNPILKAGEVGLISESAPLRFKVGNGADTWQALPWGNVQKLAQLMDDTTHRLVTDEEKRGWNERIRGYVFDFEVYQTPNGKAPQQEIGKKIFSDVQAGMNPLVIMKGRTKNTSLFIVESVTSAAITGIIAEIVSEQTAVGTYTLSQTRGKFTSGGDFEPLAATTLLGGAMTTAAIVNELGSSETSRPLSAAQGKALNEKIANIKVPEYSLVKAATESGFASTYQLQKDNVKVGASINIPLDQVLRASSIKSVTTAGVPYAGAKVGDKYIEFLFQNNSTPQYLPVQDLVDIYTGDNIYIEVTNSNVIQLNYQQLMDDLANSFSDAFDASGAGVAAAQAAVDAFARKDFVIKCTIPGVN